MKRRTIITTVLVLVMALSLLVGAACTVNVGEQGERGVGVESTVDNGNGTFTITLTDGSSFTTDNLTGPQGAQGGKGDKGDTGAQGAQMSTGYWDTGISWDWSEGEGAFLIEADDLPILFGSGFSPNVTAKIQLVVGPTSSVLVATVTTNSIGCFCADLTELNQAGDPIRVYPDANLDWISRESAYGTTVQRDCYLRAEVGGQQVATLPIVLCGDGPQSELQAANAELVTLMAAIESCLADANAARFDADVAGWDGSARATGPVIDYPVGGTVEYAVYDQMRTHQFKAAYDISTTGDVTNGDPTIPGGWGSNIRWNATDDVWEETP